MKLKKSLANQPWNHPLIAYMRSAFESKNHIAESTETRDSSLASGRAFYFMATFRGIATQECPKVSESRIGKNREHRAQAALEKWSVYGPSDARILRDGSTRAVRARQTQAHGQI